LKKSTEHGKCAQHAQNVGAARPDARGNSGFSLFFHDFFPFAITLSSYALIAPDTHFQMLPSCGSLSSAL
jgi:hypothetical protein